MAVQLPTINRNEPLAPTRTQLSQVQSIDAATPAAQTSRQITQTIGAVDKAFEDYAKRTVDVKSTESTTKLETWSTERVEGYVDPVTGQKVIGLRNIEGDPTEKYAEFDKDLKVKYEELSNDFASLPDRQRQKAQAKLKAAYDRVKINTIVLEGRQSHKYRQGVYDAGVALDQREAAQSAGYISVRDFKGTVKPFESAIISMIDKKISNGLDVGLVTETEDGKYKLSKLARQEIGETVSKSTYDAVKALIDQGRVKEAEALLEHASKTNYQNITLIDPVNKSILEKKLSGKTTQVAAAQIAESLVMSSSKERDQALVKIKNAEVKQEVRKILNDQDRYITQRKKRDSYDAYSETYKAVDKIQRSSDPMITSTQLENNPAFKKNIDYITDPKQRQALYDMVEKPKRSSNPDKVSEMYEVYRLEGFKGISHHDFQLMKGGKLSQKHSEMFDRLWAQEIETPSEEASRLRLMQQLAYKKAVSTKDEDGRFYVTKVKGKLTKRSQERINRINDKIIQDFGSAPIGLTNGEMQSYVNELVIDDIESEKKEPGLWDRFTNWVSGDGSKKETKTEVNMSTESKVDIDKLSDEDTIRLIDLYERETGEKLSGDIDADTRKKLTDLYIKNRQEF